MSKPVAPLRAMQRPQLASPRIGKAATAILRVLGPAYARFALKVSRVEFVNVERLAQAYKAFEEGRERLLLAFRHPYGDEPQVLLSGLFHKLPKLMKALGLPTKKRPRALFVHGYEVPLWSGGFVRWLLPRTGAMPVYHARLDRESLAKIRKALLNGPFPLALAPEGQATYHSESLPRLEGGTLRFAHWCVEDLKRAGRSERVAVLPLSIHYRFERNEKKLNKLLSDLEAKIDGTIDASDFSGDEYDFTRRLESAYSKLLSLAEEFYGMPAEGKDAESRKLAIMQEALKRGEATLGLAHSGQTIDRVYRIRQEGWDRVYPAEGLPHLDSVKAGLWDRRAGEAWYAMRHMEFVDLLEYIDPDYWRGEPSFDRIVECVYNLCDLASRLVGGNITNRPNILKKRVVILSGNPIAISGGREKTKAENQPDAEELKRGFMECIAEYRS